MSSETNTLLYDTEQERELIGMMLSGMYNHLFAQCATMLSHDDFEDMFCQDVWTVMEALGDKQSPVDAASVIAKAPSLGINLDMKDVALAVDTSNRINYPIEVAIYLSDLATRRKLQHDLMRNAISLNDLDHAVEDIIASSRKVLDNTASRADSDRSNMDVYHETVKEWEQRYNGTTVDGIMSGFHYIDRKGGLQPSDLDIIAGETSYGKTSLALAIALNAAKAGIPVAMFSLEMSLKQLFARLTSMESGVDSELLQYSRLDAETFQIAFDHAARLAPMPIYYDGTRSSNIDFIERAIRRMKMKYGTRLIVIDYVQLITDPKSKDEKTRVGGAANMLKNLAVELDICIIMLSQMRRPKPGESPVPIISRLKESGDIENAADNIYMVYRAEIASKRYNIPNLLYPDMSDQWSKYDPHGTALIIHGKARNTGIGEFMLAFDGELTRFSDITTPPLLTADSPLLNPKANEEPPF